MIKCKCKFFRLKFLKKNHRSETYSLTQHRRVKRQKQTKATRMRLYVPVRTADYRSQQVRLSSSTRRACGNNTVEQETEERTANVATSLFARASLAIKLNNFVLTRCRLPRTQTECVISLLFSSRLIN